MECRDLARGGPRRGLSVRCTFTCFHNLAEGAWVAFDDALEPPSAACWREGWVWSEVDSSMTLQALLGPRDRDNRFLSRFLKKLIILPALLRGRERCTYPLPKQFPLSLGRPSWGLLLLCLPPVDVGQDGRGGLPTPSSTAPLLEAAADAVRERGWMQGAALGDEQAGRCNRRTGGGSSCPPRQEVLDRLSLLLCSRELLGHVTGCVAEKGSLGYRNLEEPTLSASLCQPDTARGGAPGPQVWTSHDPETVP